MRQLTTPLGCYEATYTENGRTTTIVHHCTDPKCPGNGG